MYISDNYILTSEMAVRNVLSCKQNIIKAANISKFFHWFCFSIIFSSC